jgi:hypothetical protein
MLFNERSHIPSFFNPVAIPAHVGQGCHAVGHIEKAANEYRLTGNLPCDL